MITLTIISLAITLGIVALKVGAGVSAYHSLKEALDVTDMGKFKELDQPVNDLIVQSVYLLDNFTQKVQLVLICCAFLCLIFNAFKLWSSTIEIKKAFVDIIYKSLIVMILVLIWPSVLDKTYNIATELGVEGAGGYELLQGSFESVAKHTTNIIKEGTSEFIEIIKNGAKKDGDNLIISTNAMSAFTKVGMTEEEAKAYLETQGITVGDSGARGWWIFGNSIKKQEDKAKKVFSSTEEHGMLKDNENPYLSGVKSRQDYIKQNIIVLRSMSEILTGVPKNELGQTDVSKILNMSEESLNSVFYNPFVDGTKRLSMSTMLKTSLIMSKAFAEGSLAPFDDLANYSDDEIQAQADAYWKHENLPVILKFIGAIAKYFVYNLAMPVCTIILLLEYSITIIEFLIVGAICMILIPLFFIDSTKQFVTNFIKTIFSYFVKLLVTTMMCFFIMGMYLRMSESMYTKYFSDTATIYYYVFVLFLGLILAKGSGKVASAVISGNPSLGFGELAHEFRGAMHLGHMAARQVEGVARGVAKAAGTGAKAAAVHDAGAASWNKAGKDTTTQTYKDMVAKRDQAADLQKRFDAGEQLSEQEMTQLQQGQGLLAMSKDDMKAEARNAGNLAKSAARSQFYKDWMFSKAAGFDRIRGEDGALRVGQMFWDKEKETHRQATLRDVENASKEIAQESSSAAIKSIQERFGRKMDSDEGYNDLEEKAKRYNWPTPGL